MEAPFARFICRDDSFLLPSFSRYVTISAFDCWRFHQRGIDRYTESRLKDVAEFVGVVAGGEFDQHMEQFR